MAFAGKREIIDYYDSAQAFYNAFWSRDHIHWGLWETTTKNHKEALKNTGRFLANCLEVSADDHLLDAGCGVGGTAIYLARTFGTRVTAINLSRRQLGIAQKRAMDSEGAHLIAFEEGDFTETRFADGAFTKIYAIESVCHAPDKAAFAREAFRLLQGGRVAVVDTFLLKGCLSPDEERYLRQFKDSVAIPNVLTIGEFEACLHDAGFSRIEFHDKLHEAWPSITSAARLGSLTAPLLKVLNSLRAIPAGAYRQTIGCLSQKRLFQSKAATYGVFLAHKPSDREAG